MAESNGSIAAAQAAVQAALAAGRAGGKMLDLAGTVSARAPLAGVDLAGARLRRARLAFADLTGADVGRAFLAQADLTGALYERCAAAGTDFGHAVLSGAQLGEAQMRGALMEDTRLDDANLRFADLTDAVLENADLTRADLWGAKLDGADLQRAVLQAARLGEASAARADFSRADLRDAVLISTSFAGARFADADLRGATLADANLSGADLSGSRLEDVDLRRCQLARVCWSRARLDRKMLEVDQLIGPVGEEAVGDWDGAVRSYTALELNFLSLGEPDAATWAYLRKRRMRKAAAGARTLTAWRARQFTVLVPEGARYIGDQLIETVCDYGESVPRVLGALTFVYLLFLTIYGITGSISRVVGDRIVVSTHVIDLAIFSLMAMTTSGTPSVGLMPTDRIALLLSGAQALLGIFLTGLLGFVAGNRIRR